MRLVCMAAATPASPPRCARELDATAQVTIVVADAYPNFSICGIPYFISGEVTQWRSLAHRTYADLEATGMRLRLDTTAVWIDAPGQRIAVRDGRGAHTWIGYDELVVGTVAVPVRPPIAGLDHLGPDDGAHVLHSMGDTFALTYTLDTIAPKPALIVGAGYVGLEVAEGLTARGLAVTQVETLPEVLPTVDPELGALVHAELVRHGVDVHTPSTVTAITRTPGGPARLRVEGTGVDHATLSSLTRRWPRGCRTCGRPGLCCHPPPPARPHLPAPRHHRTQAGQAVSPAKTPSAATATSPGSPAP